MRSSLSLIFAYFYLNGRAKSQVGVNDVCRDRAPQSRVGGGEGDRRRGGGQSVSGSTGDGGEPPSSSAASAATASAAATATPTQMVVMAEAAGRRGVRWSGQEHGVIGFGGG